MSDGSGSSTDSVTVTVQRPAEAPDAGPRDDDDDGCGVAGRSGNGLPFALLFALLFVRRRRSR